MQAVIKQWSEFNKSAFISAQKLADINTHLMMNLAQHQLDTFGIYMENSQKQIQSLTQTKRMQDILETQYQMATEVNKKLVHQVRMTMEIFVDTKNQLTEWTETGWKQAAEFNPFLKYTQPKT